MAVPLTAEDAQLPARPPSPDDDVTLADLERAFARASRRWATEAKTAGSTAAAFQHVFEQLVPAAGPEVCAVKHRDDNGLRPAASAAPPVSSPSATPEPLCLDTVVLIALGSLSSSAVPALLADDAAPADSPDAAYRPSRPASHRRRPVVAGERRETSMLQLVAVEAWIAALRRRGHPLPAAGATTNPAVSASASAPASASASASQSSASSSPPTSTPTPTSETSTSPYTVPAVVPYGPSLLVQDPLLNRLDAEFLAARGWTVLPSTPAACRPRAVGTPADPAHALAHVTPRTVLVAPHAPHSLIHAAVGNSGTGPAGDEGPGGYVGNQLEELEQSPGEGSGAQGDGAWQTCLPSRHRRRRRKRQVQWCGSVDEQGEAASASAPADGATEWMARRAAWLARRRAIMPGAGMRSGAGGLGEMVWFATGVYVVETRGEADKAEDQTGTGGAGRGGVGRAEAEGG